MKPFSFIRLTTGVMAFLAMVVANDLNAANAGGKETMGQAKIQRINGSASYTENGKSGILKAGMTLGEGATITTTPGSQVQVWLGDNGQLLQIIENSTVSINKLRLEKTPADVVAHTELELKKGGLIGNVKKLSKASKFDVKYAEGVAGIRGTEWAILPGAGVICSEGSVVVTFNVGGVISTVTISAGQVALPPTTPGGAPRVIDGIPAEFAKMIVDAVNGGNPPQTTLTRGESDNKPPASANTGTTVTVTVTRND